MLNIKCYFFNKCLSHLSLHRIRVPRPHESSKTENDRSSQKEKSATTAISTSAPLRDVRRSKRTGASSSDEDHLHQPGTSTSAAAPAKSSPQKKFKKATDSAAPVRMTTRNASARSGDERLKANDVSSRVKTRSSSSSASSDDERLQRRMARMARIQKKLDKEEAARHRGGKDEDGSSTSVMDNILGHNAVAEFDGASRPQLDDEPRVVKIAFNGKLMDGHFQG